MSKTIQKDAINLSLDIANLVNKVNNNCYTTKEILDVISVEYQTMIENNDKQMIIDLLQDELENSYGTDLQHTLQVNSLLHQVITF